MSEVEKIHGVGICVGIVTDQKTNRNHVMVVSSNSELCLTTTRARQLATDLLLHAQRVDEYNEEIEDEPDEVSDE